MAETPRILKLTINNKFVDKIIEQLNEMKTNNNKIVKIASADKAVVLVISHIDNELTKKKE